MPEQVPPEIKAERARAMRTVATASARAFRERFVGRTLRVLWETPRQEKEETIWSGLTGNYLRVHVASSEDLTNTLTPTRLVALAGSGLRGKIERQKSGG
jgi:threonylcarbamoyladenosine tRNA methylthiotransferase MtaB